MCQQQKQRGGSYCSAHAAAEREGPASIRSPPPPIMSRRSHPRRCDAYFSCAPARGEVLRHPGRLPRSVILRQPTHIHTCATLFGKLAFSLDVPSVGHTCSGQNHRLAGELQLRGVSGRQNHFPQSMTAGPGRQAAEHPTYTHRLPSIPIFSPTDSHDPRTYLPTRNYSPGRTSAVWARTLRHGPQISALDTHAPPRVIRTLLASLCCRLRGWI